MRRLVRISLYVGALAVGWLLFLEALAASGLSLPFLKCIEDLASASVPTGWPMHHPDTAAADPSPAAPAVGPAAPAVAPAALAVAPAASTSSQPASVIPTSLRMIVAPEFYAVPGIEMSLYFDNLVLTEYPDRLRFQMTCDIGHAERRRWAVVPATADVGAHPILIVVADMKGKELARAKTVLHVLPEAAGAEKDLRLLIVGDSYVHHTYHINALARLLDRPGNPRWKMLGTHVVEQALPTVRHEGYGGWTWHDFVAFNDPELGKLRHRVRSPFLFPAPDGDVRLDVGRYFRESCDGQPPHLTIFELGLNDVFCARPNVPGQLDAVVTDVLKNADTLLAEFRRADPNMALAIFLPPQMTVYERIFFETYGPEFTRWRIRQNLHRYHERALEHFAGREKDGIFLIPTYMSIDAIDAYPVDDPGHPNELGCRQFSASIYAWMKHWYAHHPRPTPAQAGPHPVAVDR